MTVTASGDQVTSAVAGVATTGAAAWLAMAGDVAIQLLGVPLPVVVAAIAGALLARVYLPTLAFAAALGRSMVWAIVACVGSQGASAAIGVASVTVPVGALGLVALLLSGLGPKLWPVLVEQAPLMLRGWLGKLGGGEPKGGDDAPK
jgi:hypothetical protein